MGRKEKKKEGRGPSEDLRVAQAQLYSSLTPKEGVRVRNEGWPGPRERRLGAVEWLWPSISGVFAFVARVPFTKTTCSNNHPLVCLSEEGLRRA